MSKPKNERRENRGAAATASICADTWVTSVNGLDDGEVEVEDDVTGVNKLKGTHKKSGDRITGHCTPGPPHLIHLERTDSAGTLHTYDGRIVRVNLPLPGTVPITLVIGTHKPATKANGDDDWMGGHTT